MCVSRLQNIRRCCSTMVPSRTSLLCSSLPPIRCTKEINCFSIYYCILNLYRVFWVSNNGLWTLSVGTDAGVKVFLSFGLWERSGLHDTGEWWARPRSSSVYHHLITFYFVLLAYVHQRFSLTSLFLLQFFIIFGNIWVTVHWDKRIVQNSRFLEVKNIIQKLHREGLRLLSDDISQWCCSSPKSAITLLTQCLVAYIIT